MSTAAATHATITSAVQAVLADEKLSVDDKRKLLAELASSLLTTNLEVKKTAAQLVLAEEKKSSESNKFMDKFMSLTKEKENIMAYNKKMMSHLQEIKKNTEGILDQLKQQKEDYQRRFEELMRKLEEEYNYDEKKCQTVAEENERLRARSERISADIQAIETEYNNNLNNLRQDYEASSKETEEKYNSIKENAQLVDDLREEVRQLETKKRTVKASLSAAHTKNNEVETLLKSSFEPLRGYLGESNKVASRSKAAALKKEDYLRLKEEINQAVLNIMAENDDLQEKLVASKQGTTVVKQKAKEVMQEYQSLSAASKPK